MAYTINRTSDNASGFNVADGQLRDDFLSIRLIGKGFTNYGEIVQENIVHVMENFANPLSPPNPIPGQLWFETGNDLLWVWKSDGTGWKDIQQPLDARIFDQHINADAKIAISKLAPTQPGKIIVGDANASAIPTYVTMTGDINIDSSGITKIQSNTVNTLELGSVIDQNMVIGNISTAANRSLDVIAHDAYIASIDIRGASQGSGQLFVGESASIGGGLMYNGDNNPIMSGSQDKMVFYRRNAGTDTEVFYYGYDSDIVVFNDEIQSPRFRTGPSASSFTFLEDNFLQIQGNGDPRIELRSQDGGNPYIDFSTSLTGDYGARVQLETDDLLRISGASLEIGSTTQAQDTTLAVLAGDSNIASIEAFGNDQGTGMLYVGQSSTYGGGIAFNGDDNPALPFTDDAVSFYRRSAGTDTEVFRYSHNSSDVTFNGNTIAPNYLVNNAFTRITEGNNDSIRLQTGISHVDIGSQSAGWTHFEAPNPFWFNTDIWTAGQYKFYSAGQSISGGPTNSFQFNSNSRYATFGPRNSSWNYIETNVSEGHYFGGSIIRTDYQLQVGGSGDKFKADNSGNVTIGGNGYLYCKYVNMAGDSTTSTPSSVFVETSSDNWARKQNFTTFREKIVDTAWWTGTEDEGYMIAYHTAVQGGNFYVGTGWDTAGWIYFPTSFVQTFSVVLTAADSDSLNTTEVWIDEFHSNRFLWRATSTGVDDYILWMAFGRMS